MRQKQIIGNWKMNGTLQESCEYFDFLLPKLSKNLPFKVKLAVPYTLLTFLFEKVKESCIEIGAQNMHAEENGPFTGEISSNMIQDAGARFVLLGHSERRQLLNESDILIQKKIKKAFSVGLKVVLCIGETLEERESGREKNVLTRQILEGIPPEIIGELALAYEPVWAIGTGCRATDAQVEEIHAFCRELYAVHWGKEAAQALTILYGGSVTPSNASALLRKENIDGALVGGASLNPESFLQIIQSL